MQNDPRRDRHASASINSLEGAFSVDASAESLSRSAAFSSLREAMLPQPVHTKRLLHLLQLDPLSLGDEEEREKEEEDAEAGSLQATGGMRSALQKSW
jgi:hypothetical protein